MLRQLELKIMPMALMLICALLMAALKWVLPTLDLPLLLNDLFGSGLILLGVAIVLAGGWAFRKAQTTFNPRTPAAARELVVSGVYRYSRNPMYLGFLIILLGWADLLANLASFTVLPLFILYLNRFQIQPEERSMHALFGAQFVRYCQQVRRWI
ncbi:MULTISPECIES: methyltransferase family protein [Deefgea]|uniref:Isoprenylcysteine carboxylmethyltransferase family protein n=1 Tax=Deefgea chitinilytica TaxID=570276 RepID=A0ABS2CCZ6_9NEIS|nr:MULTISPECIES: isoprenylcysteine carboxylmethyltransferase family protein [Deefgea]MBM5571328.1 isoprenylcysteine carboxylmethyltransferase family protein [Deefgea chitinilytica]MBM9888560.1 isoprenylcysteine carboxylmethyltransferase family protein [Deefgea sp. CFH1-16]